jgi:hypothetical protein
MKLYYIVIAFVLVGCSKRRSQIKIRKMDVHIHHYSVEDETKELYKYEVDVE